MRSQKVGARFDQSCETATVAVALTRRQAKLAEMGEPTSLSPRKPEAPIVTMRDLFHLDYDRARTDENNPGTLSSMVYGYRNLERLIPAAQVARPTPSLLQQYVRNRRAEGVGNNTIRKELILYRCGLRQAYAEQIPVRLITEMPKLSLINPKPGQSSTYRTVDHLRAWLAELQPESRAVALVYLLTGVRHEEGARLQPEHLIMWKGPSGVEAYLGMPATITKPKVYRRVCLTRLGLIAFRMAVPIDRDHRSAYQGASDRADICPYVHDRDLRAAFASIGSGLGDPYTLHLAMGHGKTTASTYQHQDMARLAGLTQYVETQLGLTPDWLRRAHLCKWRYSRGRQRQAPEGL